MQIKRDNIWRTYVVVANKKYVLRMHEMININAYAIKWLFINDDDAVQKPEKVKENDNFLLDYWYYW